MLTVETQGRPVVAAIKAYWEYGSLRGSVSIWLNQARRSAGGLSWMHHYAKVRHRGVAKNAQLTVHQLRPGDFATNCHE